jgi:hypothetical protein
MATIRIRRLDKTMMERLQLHAAEDGRCIEDEVREILRAAVTVPVALKPSLGNGFVFDLHHSVESTSIYCRAGLSADVFVKQKKGVA